jgi:glutaminyl-tRNA synthetase
MYDYSHPLSDAIEGITHSVCTLEFEDHRPLYNWAVEESGMECRPRQIEFARLNLTYTVMSKRRLLQLVTEGRVEGWDDPRMPTISGLRRRGYTPEAIRDFAERIGVAKMNSTVDAALLDHCLREDLNRHARRVMVILDPVKVIIDNYPADQEEWLEAENNPEDPEAGNRKVPFAREIFIEREDFMEEPPKKFFRLAPGREIRLKHAYYITCVSVDKDPSTGEITAIHCTYDPESRGGGTEDGRKVKGTSHWVSTRHAVDIEVRLYDKLFTTPDPGSESGDFLNDINESSLQIITARAEPSLLEAEAGTSFQFLRKGYFIADPKESVPGKPLFNRTVGLRDSWAKAQKNQTG